MAGTYELPVGGEKNTTADAKVKAILKGYNESLDSSNKILGTSLAAAAGITNAQLAAAAKPFTWYTPKVIATEQTRENVAFATLTTADEITGIVLPENGLIVVGYGARWRSSVAAAGRAGLFLSATQARNGLGGVVEPATTGTENCLLTSSPGGLASIENAGGGPFATTGVTVGHQSAVGGSTAGLGGVAHIYAAAGTYTISVQFKATSGSVTVKERKLWVYTVGV